MRLTRLFLLLVVVSAGAAAQGNNCSYVTESRPANPKPVYMDGNNNTCDPRTKGCALVGYRLQYMNARGEWVGSWSQTHVTTVQVSVLKCSR